MDDQSTPLIPPFIRTESSSYSAETIEEHQCIQEQLNLPHLGSTRFNILLYKRLFRILKVLFPRFCSVTLAVFVFFVFVCIAAQYNYYYSGLIPSKFYASLTAHKLEDFKESIYQSVIILISACVCKSATDLVAGIIYVRWRALLTQYIHKQYFNGRNFYKLNVTEKAVDNPDQRITQDVERFCNQLATQIIPKLILWPFVVVYYTYKTYNAMGYIGVLAIYGYFIVVTVTNKFLMGPVIALVVKQENREGDFRFQHVQVRTNAESIAFYDGGHLEGEKARTLLGRLLKTQLNLVHWMFPLNFSVDMFDYFSSIVTYVVLGILVFSGHHYSDLSPSELASVISQNAFFSLYLLNNFSTFVDQSTNVADMAGYAHRIGHLLEVLDRLNKYTTSVNVEIHPNLDGSSISEFDDSDSDYNATAARYSITERGPVAAFIFDDVTIIPPGSDKILVEGLSFRFERGKNILITGQSGSGKSSLLRILKRLWTPVKGSAYICLIEGNTEVMFLPQKSLLTTGSLADQVVYPLQAKENVSNDLDFCLFENRVNEALRLAGLLSLKTRLGGVNIVFDGNWNDYISPGEMQKIAFARLIYHKPSFAVLDEATSSLSEEDEDYFYNLLHQMGTTFLTIGHRSSVKKYHHIILTLFGRDGQWQMSTLVD